jgi:hypothetical protein
VSESLGSGAVLVRDLLLGAEGPAGPHGVPGGLIRSDLLVCRLVSLGATRRPGLSLLRLPGPLREELMAYLRAAYQMARPSRHVSLDDFLDRSAHLYHHFLQARGRAAGGEAHDTAPPAALAAARIAYRGTDTRRIRAALGRQPALEPAAAEGEEWAWLDLQIGIPQAHVRLAEGRVEVSADTREALAEGRQFLEGVLRGLIELPGEVQSAPPPAAAAAGTGTVRGAAFLQRMLDAWAETPSATLGGRIPREALQTPAGRADVAAALLALERDIARQKRLGRAWVDVAPLREALGVPAPAPPVTRQSIR